MTLKNQINQLKQKQEETLAKNSHELVAPQSPSFKQTMNNARKSDRSSSRTPSKSHSGKRSSSRSPSFSARRPRKKSSRSGRKDSNDHAAIKTMDGRYHYDFERVQLNQPYTSDLGTNRDRLDEIRQRSDDSFRNPYVKSNSSNGGLNESLGRTQDSNKINEGYRWEPPLNEMEFLEAQNVINLANQNDPQLSRIRKNYIERKKNESTGLNHNSSSSNSP